MYFIIRKQLVNFVPQTWNSPQCLLWEHITDYMQLIMVYFVSFKGFYSQTCM